MKKVIVTMTMLAQVIISLPQGNRASLLSPKEPESFAKNLARLIR